MAGRPIAARIFGPGLPDGGTEVRVEAGPGGLRVHGATELQVGFGALRSQAGGFSHDALNLGWSSPEGEFALVIRGQAARTALLESAPEALRAVLQPYRRSVFALNSMLQLLLLLTVTLVLAAGLLVWQYDAAVGWVASKVPLETEERIGRMGLESLQEQWTLQDEGPLVEIVTTLGARLTPASRYDYQWYVADDEMVNAMALPGGTIIVFRGLLEAAESVEEVAGVLAHEVQHVELQHSLRNMIHSAGWAAVLGVALGDVSGILAVLAHQMGANLYSRELESAADAAAIPVLHAVAIDPAGLLSFFKRLSAEGDDTAAQLEKALAYLSTHPAPGDRLSAARALIDALPQRDYETLPLDLQAALGTAGQEREAD